VKGIVKEYHFRSPHSSIDLEVVGADGSATLWTIEMHSVPSLRRMGMDQDTFEPGDSITVTAQPNRDPNNTLAFGLTFITKSGAVVGERRRLADAGPVDGESHIDRLSGRWQANMGPPENTDETPLPLTAAGRTAWENFDPNQSPTNTCEPVTVPAVLGIPYLYDIRFDGDAATLTNELFNIVRVVPLNGEPQKVEASEVHGIVAGRMDGDVLVIENSAFPASGFGIAISAGLNGVGADVPSSTQKTVIERYSASDDGKTLRLEYTLEDPVYLAQPYAGAIEFRRVADDTPMHPFECDVESSEIYLSKSESTTD
jgi:hypothetical protein